MITVSKYNAHTEPLFKDLTILQIEDIRKVQQLKFYFKYNHSQLPSYFNNNSKTNKTTDYDSFELKMNSNVRCHNTRHKTNLHSEHKKHKFAEKCLRHNIVKTINNTHPLSLILDKIHTLCLECLKNYAKHYFISNYTHTCVIQNGYICNKYENS